MTGAETFPKGSLREAIELAARENYERGILVMGEEDTGPWPVETMTNSEVKKTWATFNF